MQEFFDFLKNLNLEALVEKLIAFVNSLLGMEAL